MGEEGVAVMKAQSQSPKMKKKKRVRRSESKHAKKNKRKGAEVEVQVANGDDDDEFMPVVPRKSNPYADIPKKMDDILGPIRNQPPPPPIIPAEPPSVFFETGNYSISGLNADVRLKQVALPGRKLDLSRRGDNNNNNTSRIREPKFQVPGKPVKFPKPPKPKEKIEPQLSPPPQTPLNEPPMAVENNEPELIVLEENLESADVIPPQQTLDIKPKIQEKQPPPIKIERMISKEEQVEAWLTKAHENEGTEPNELEEEAKMEELIEGKMQEEEELLIPLEVAQHTVTPPQQQQQKQEQQQQKQDSAKKPKKPIATKPALPKTLVKPAVASPPPQEMTDEPSEAFEEPLEDQPEEVKPTLAQVITSQDNQDDAKMSGPIRIGINGFERTGRLVLLAALEAGIDVVAINDAFTPANFMVYALKYDLAHGASKNKKSEVRLSPTGQIMVGSKSVDVLDTKDSDKIPWECLGVNCVVETVPPLTQVREAKRHLRKAGGRNAQGTSKSMSMKKKSPSLTATATTTTTTREQQQ